MNGHPVGGLIGFIALAVFLVAMLVWHHSRAGSLLDQWARSNGFTILSREICLFFRGPFFWTTTKGQEVYRIRVRDQAGNPRSGYVRVGGAWLGMMSDHVEARWDD